MIAAPKQPKRVDSEKHRRFVAEHRCILCTKGVLVFAGYVVSQCCHDRRGFFCKGKRPCDSKTTPMCYQHHEIEQHKMNEQAFWDKHGIDPSLISAQLSEKSPDKRIRELVA